MSALLFVLLFLLFIIGVPIAFSLGLASALTVYLGDMTHLVVIIQQTFNAINSFPLMAIPFFILAGYLMQHGGISQRLVDFSDTLVGNMSGGLAMVAILTSLFFSAISGSGAATTAAIGSILIPAMAKKGYDIKFAAATHSAAGSLGVILPPSIPLILFGVAAGVSIGDMFLAAILPGILVAFSFLVYAYVYSRNKNYVGTEKSSIKDIFVAARKAILAILMPLIVLGGIYGGIFTPTEAAVVAVVYAFIVGTLVYRAISLSKVMEIFKDSAVMSANILIIIGTAGLFGFIMQRLDIPDAISATFVDNITSVILFILIANLILLVVGMFIEAAAAILIFVPILLPIAAEFGIDPVHFGIIMIVNLAMGMFTPPVGLNLFVASGISGVGVMKLIKPVVPFVIILFVDVLLISFLPFLATWLPSL
ncbi:TRAP transporter large permease [Shouchella shacheensis]|uniref:TRAP transporter large permease n=1 Tax=Shouchella shacheensis TaxID=1649580 RepID=UPI00074043D2|nr:TRAP transporter large permease [Shouchella shacheensis]